MSIYSILMTKVIAKNIAMSRDGSIEMGVDFVRIYKDVLKILRKTIRKVDFTRTLAFQSSHW
jgi:hypothetical protein